jgi:hypothetical protein
MLTNSLWSRNGRIPITIRLNWRSWPCGGQYRIRPRIGIRTEPTPLPPSRTQYSDAAQLMRSSGRMKRALACVDLVDGHPCIQARPLHRSVRTEHQGLRLRFQPAVALVSFVIWVIGSTVPPWACRGRSSPLPF